MTNPENIEVAPSGKFEVQELHANGEWENTWSIENDAGDMIPQVFNTAAEAQSELDDHLKELEREEMDPEPENYRVVPVGVVDRQGLPESLVDTQAGADNPVSIPDMVARAIANPIGRAKRGTFYKLCIEQDRRKTDWFFDIEEEFKKAKEIASLASLGAEITYEGTVDRLPAGELISDADELLNCLESDEHDGDEQAAYVGNK